MAGDPDNYPYLDEAYKRHREASLGVIPKSNVLSAIKNNSGLIYQGLITAAAAAIVAGIIHVPVIGIISLIGAALVAATASAYAGYRDEQMSKTVDKGYGEARQIVDSRVQAQELATALQQTIGQEMKEIKQENAQTQQALVKLGEQVNYWQERERVKLPESRILH